MMTEGDGNHLDKTSQRMTGEIETCSISGDGITDGDVDEVINDQ